MLGRLLLLALLTALVAGACTQVDDAASEVVTSAASAATTTIVVLITTAGEQRGSAVPADEAQIDITYTDEGTTYVGDREIIEGTVTVTFSNETDSEAIVALLRYATGSAALAEELELAREGNSFVTADAPTEGYVEVDLEGSSALAPGSHTWTVDLETGTHLFDVGPLDFHVTGLWRAAVFEVVGE